MLGNLAEKLEKLAILRNVGNLTEETFTEAKGNLLKGLPAFPGERERFIEALELKESSEHGGFWALIAGNRLLHGIFYIVGMLLSLPIAFLVIIAGMITFDVRGGVDGIFIIIVVVSYCWVVDA